MAMLAEPRRKQKLSLDPRNRSWSDDQTKFGQKMLEKMGWESGKGLGANLDGKTDHIKVSLKNNTLGVGCSPSQEDNWIAHQDDFNDILATLNQDHVTEESNEDNTAAAETEESSSKGLEEKSKKSRSRVHYKKFTRGKDLSKYGATDINCILGVRANRSTPSTPITQSANNSDSEDSNERSTKEEKDSNENEDTSHGITTITQNTSMQDYFAQKMAELKKSRPLPQQQTKASESDENDADVLQDDKDVESKTKKKKKKKKRKQKCDDDDKHGGIDDADGAQKSSTNSEDNCVVNYGVEEGVDRISEEMEDNQPRKKKCKRKKKDEELEQVSVELNNSSGIGRKKNKKKQKKSIE